MKLKIYGCKGSAPVSLGLTSQYGGNTSCMTVESSIKNDKNSEKDNILIMDAGSGLLLMESELRKNNPNYPKDLSFRPNILLSHLHLDHIIGLTMFELTYTPNSPVRIFTRSRDSKKSLKTQVLGAFMPPYWPVPLENISHIQCIETFDDKSFEIGVFTITPYLAQHPDKTQSFHITDGVKTIVHLLDSEIANMDIKRYEKLVKYCSNADLVIFDAAYLPHDYESKKGWGHSTIEHGIKLADKCKCEKMLFSHFSHKYDDKQLDSMIDYLAPYGYGERFLLANDALELQL